MRLAKTTRYSLFAALGLGLLGGHLALGQVNLANFRGVVTDPSGAAIPAATVTALKNDQGLTRTTKSLPDGSWELPGLLPGTYTVSVEKEGFKKYVDDTLVLHEQDVRRVDVKLEVGSTSQTVEVSAKAAIVSTEETGINETFAPIWQEYRAGLRTLNGPEFELRIAGGQGHFSGRGGFQWINHGSEGNETTASMDGIDQTNLGNFRVDQYMTKEEKLWMVDAPAEFEGSGTMQSTSPSGTNQLHGMFLIEIGNNSLNGLGPAHTTRGPGIPNENYEIAAGGPIFIPHVYNGRNKTFWYFTTYQKRGSTSTPVQFIYPYMNMRNGNLSIYTTQIHDVNGTPFPGNQIPTNRISPIATAILNQYIPMPTAPPSIGLVPNYVQQSHSFSSFENYLGHVDQKVSNSNTASFALYHLTTLQSGNFYSNPLDGGYSTPYGADGVSIQDTHIFTPHIVNEAIFTWMDEWTFNNYGNQSGTSFLTSIGLTNAAFAPFVPPNELGAPEFSVPGFGNISQTGGPNFLGGQQGTSTTRDIRYTLNDNLSYQRGKHLIKGGFAWNLRTPQKLAVTANGGAWGIFNYNGFATGQAFADFLLGIPSSTSVEGTRGVFLERGDGIGAYIQDEYKVTPKVTVNIGVRYQTFLPVIDTTGKFYNFDFQTMKVVIPNNSMGYVVPGYPAGIPIETASQANYPNNLLPNPHLGGFEPRLGVSWRPWGNKTVIRLGYGLYHVPIWSYYTGTLDFGPQTTGPFQLSESFPNNTITNGTPAQTVGFINPANTTAAPLITPFPSAGGAVGAQAVTAYPPGMKLGYTQQWNFTVEHDLGKGVGIRASYIGAKTTDMPYPTNMQTIYPPSTTPFSTSRLPIQPTSLWASVTLLRNGGNMDYSGGELEVHRKFSRGLFLSSTLNWNKNLRDIYYSASPDYPFDRSRDKGTDDQSEPLIWITALVWPVPIGRGQRFLNFSGGGASGVLNQIVSGWTVSNTFSITAGYTYTALYSGFDTTGTNITSGRADKVCSQPHDQRPGHLWWNPACFRVPSVDGTTNALTSTGATNMLGRFGDGPYGDLRGPGWYYTESSIFKEFSMVPAWGDKSPRLRISAYIENTLNHPTSGGLFGCNEQVTSPSFGSCPVGSGAWNMNEGRVLTLVGQILF